MQDVANVLFNIIEELQSRSCQYFFYDLEALVCESICMEMNNELNLNDLA